MGYVPKRTGEDTQFVRRLFDFEPLERRLLFDITPIYTLVPISSPVWTGPIIFSPGPIVSISTNGLNGSSPLTILDNRQSFTGVVATFSDSDATDPSTYSATINWGDGSPTVQGTVVSDPNGGFDVLGSHTYVFGQYTPTITITAPGENPGDGPRTLGITANLSVFPPPTACEAFPISAVNGQAFRSTIATYTGLDTTQLDRYSTSIDWGDGDQSPGQLVLNPDGSVSVVGQHVYVNPGFDDVEVTLAANGAAADVDAATAFCRATVANGLYAGKILNIAAESGVPYDENLAFFQFLGSDQDISNLRADVILSGSIDGPSTIPGTIISGDNGFYVTANALFTGDYYGQSIEVRIYDTTAATDPALGADAQLVGLAQGNVAITGHLHFTVQGANMIAGAESRVLLGHLASDDPGNLWNKSFDVVINWGDGSEASEGEAVPDSGGGYDIYGTHSYPIIGYSTSYSFWVTITETRTSANPAAPAGPFTYLVGGGTDFRNDSTAISVAAGSFTGFYIRSDTSNYIYGGQQISAELYTGVDLSPKASDIVATVQWSDGEITTAQIWQISDNEFSVFDNRSDLPAGEYTAVLSVTIGQYQRTANFAGYIEGNVVYQPPVDYSLHAQVQTVPVNAFVGDHFHGVIATFTVPGATGQASDYSCYAYIAGTINLTTSVVANSDGSFSIVADFDATSPTSSYSPWYTSSVTISNGDKYSSVPLSVCITIDPTRVKLTPEDDLHFRQRELFTTTVATFTAPSPTDTPGDFTATIDWGDGDTTTGVITEQYDGTFDISGTYGYVHNSGGMTLKITVTDSSGRSIFTYSSLYLDVDPVSITPGTPTIQYGTVSGNLANFVDDFGDSTDPSEYRVYHAALIDWGDGSITSGLVTENTDGTYSIASKHDYQADGDYQIHILVRRNTFYAWQPFDYNVVGFGDVTASAITMPGSSIIADPDSDFGVTFYVHVVGTADRPASTPLPPSASLPTDVPTEPNPPSSQPATSFSTSAISVVNTNPDSIINSLVYAHPAPAAIHSETTDSWLASDLTLPLSDQADAAINSILLDAPE